MSWNFRHMVNFWRIQRYNDVNRDAGTPGSTSAAQWNSKMKNDASEKSFDVMKWLRATPRAELYEETKNMSIDERREWESRRPTDPVLARLFDRRTNAGGGGGAARCARILRDLRNEQRRRREAI